MSSTVNWREIRAALGSLVFERGWNYNRAGRAVVDYVSDDGTVISGRVRGSQPTPYLVRVETDKSAIGMRINGTCSCPAEKNCKHVAALLIHARSEKTTPVIATPQHAAITPALVNWLHRIDAATKAGGEDYPSDIRQRLIYVIAVGSRPRRGRVTVEPFSLRLSKDNAYLHKSTKRYTISNALQAMPAAFLRGSDRRILRDLARLEATDLQFASAPIELSGTDGAALLEVIVSTGRAHWQSATQPVLQLGPARKAEVKWRLDETGAQFLDVAGADDSKVLPLAPPWYLDPATGLCGPLDLGLPAVVAGALADAPPVPPDAVEDLRRELTRRFPGRPALRPVTLAKPTRVTGKPGILLKLSGVELTPNAAPMSGASRRGEPAVALTAELAFDYDGVRVLAKEPGATTMRLRDGKPVIIERHTRSEDAARIRLQHLRFESMRKLANVFEIPPDTSDMLARLGTIAETTRFLADEIPLLEAAGWRIERAGDWPFEIVEAQGDWSAQLSEGKNVDWFEFDLGVVIDGARVNLLPALLPVLRRFADTAATRGITDALAALGSDDDKIFVRLDARRLLPLPLGRLKPMLAALVELFRTDGLSTSGTFRMSPLRAAELAILEAATAQAAALRWLGGERLRDVGKRLASFTSIAPVPPPAGLRGELRVYQRDGLAWLQFLSNFELNGILADDMGLGKTVQTLAHLLVEKESGRMDRPSLIVAPTSVIVNWRLETERFAPSLRVLTWHGPDRMQQGAALGDYDLVLTSYALVVRDREKLAEQEFHLVILDEAQAIKNPASQVTQVAQTLRARHRLCLTGTPLENHLGELWSLMHFLNPGLLGERQQFTRIFRNPIEKHGDDTRRDSLVQRLRPFLLRRTKGEVERDLPPKTEISEHLELEPRQRDVYESVRLAAYGRVQAEIAERGLARSHIVILEALLKLRQACCDPRLLKLAARGAKPAGSAKLTRLMEMIPEMLAEGRRILLFSQFTSMLALIEDELGREKIPYLRLTGETVDRETPVRRFQSGEVPLFLISLKAGGFGLNLTAADTVILFDPWWNPAVESQAIDRAHRIGQDKPVFAYKLITVGTVEAKILALQQRKRALADALLSGSPGAASRITDADLKFLFEPLDPRS